ncbi:hypothetical protein EYZ11_006435 [Aspergillus tanneri]|uniref:Beta-lactamase-related domain-containing protein n=1 Tax=Aspergillus tanneri TaxID=1220188 RepID=A0A4S3JG07_9EURO|nr:uncharacterized protein ATNIH1004_010973 [Aspergillus tanneri]KAA8642033.1 hypothetical protein ATNIH1004_010973 [Aspergillus tanneri]THC94065.1 hypothetical protein EYZ11_006435 [Aspergillus tanneri]
MTSIQGTCDPAFSAVSDLLKELVDVGDELGASICVNIDGRNVIDIWGGHADCDRTQPWKEDTIVPVWSITKTITYVAVLLLADRGVLDLYAPVAQYWPEFAVNGKENIQVRHLLSHTAGLPSWDTPQDLQSLYNIPEATKKLALQRPWWTPGTASGYHAISQGYLLGELVCRVTGQSLGEFIREELAGPRDADFYLPVPEDLWTRIGQMDCIPPFDLPEGDTIALRAFRNVKAMSSEQCETQEFRRGGVGSMMGFSNARGFNRILSIVSLNGAVDGTRFLSPETTDLIFQEQISGVDLALGFFVRFGMGFGLPPGEANKSMDWIPDGRVCYWGGYGGSFAIMDQDRKMTITYAMNKMVMGTLGNPNTVKYVRAIYAAYDKYKSKL